MAEDTETKKDIELELPLGDNDSKKDTSTVKDPDNKPDVTGSGVDKPEDTTTNDTTKTDDKPEDVETVVEIDGESYSIDDNGNAVKDGKVVYTKEQLDSFEEATKEVDENTATIEDLEKITGIEIKDENGNPVRHEMTVEGLAEREIAIKRLGEAEGFQKGFTKFLQDNPDVAEIINYKQRFGTIEGFNNTIDYSTVSLSDKEDELYNLIVTAEIHKGTNPERAKRIAEHSKADGTLKDDAKDSLDYLKRAQEVEISNRRKLEEAALQEEIEKESNFYGVTYDVENGSVKVLDVENSIYDSVVKKGVVNGYQIPLEGLKVKTDKGVKQFSRQDIFDYLAKPVYEENGVYYTQAQIDEIRRVSNPQEYAFRCILNLVGSPDQLVKEAINKDKIQTIKKLSTKKPVSKGGSVNTKITTGKPTLELPIK